jgi:hypothetical protein
MVWDATEQAYYLCLTMVEIKKNIWILVIRTSATINYKRGEKKERRGERERKIREQPKKCAELRILLSQHAKVARMEYEEQEAEETRKQ